MKEMVVLKHSRRLLLPLLFAATATSADAQRQTVTDRLKPSELAEKLYRECGERWGAPGAIAGCLLEQEKAFGNELAQVYKKALTVVATNAPLLRETQRSWLKYQGATCKFHELYARKEGSGIARALEARCLLLTTLQRLEELRQFVD
jgi:uncharacterized protein YecT (DUF1311 family)